MPLDRIKHKTKTGKARVRSEARPSNTKAGPGRYHKSGGGRRKRIRALDKTDAIRRKMGFMNRGERERFDAADNAIRDEILEEIRT